MNRTPSDCMVELRKGIPQLLLHSTTSHHFAFIATLILWVGSEPFVAHPIGYFSSSGLDVFFRPTKSQSEPHSKDRELLVTDIAAACRLVLDGESDQAKKMISELPSINAKFKSRTLLFYAAQVGNEELVRWLVSKGADISCTDSHGRTALHAAAMLGQVGCVRELLSLGASVEAADSSGKTPFHWAAALGYSTILDRMWGYNRSLHIVQDSFGWTPLHLSIAGGHHSIAQDLSYRVFVSQSGVRPNDITKLATISGKTPLHLASKSCLSSVVLNLLKSGMSPATADLRGRTSLDFYDSGYARSTSRLLGINNPNLNAGVQHALQDKSQPVRFDLTDSISKKKSVVLSVDLRGGSEGIDEVRPYRFRIYEDGTVSFSIFVNNQIITKLNSKIKNFNVFITELRETGIFQMEEKQGSQGNGSIIPMECKLDWEGNQKRFYWLPYSRISVRASEAKFVDATDAIHFQHSLMMLEDLIYSLPDIVE